MVSTRGLNFSEIAYYIAKAVVWLADIVYFFALVFASQNFIIVGGIFFIFLIFQTIELSLSLKHRKEMEKLLEGDMVSEAAKFFYLPAIFLLFYFLLASRYEIFFAFALGLIAFIKMSAYLIKRYYAERALPTRRIKKRRLL
ncbi:MAG: hypothetical protein QXL47_01850 [Candidatus Anstonellales archaeon]